MERRAANILVSHQQRKNDGESEMNASLARASILSSNLAVRCAGIAVVMVGAALWTTDVRAQVLAMTSEQSVGSTAQGAMSPADSAAPADVTDIPVRLRRQRVDYSTTEAPGTIVVDTPNTYLYFVLGGGKAIRYGIGVGRDGFTWSGAKTIERKSEWPDWLPPADMLRRQPYLPRFMAGGPGNPLGARAMYLSGTVYRIHGTNKPSSIGKHVSSGCIRMLNEDVIDLYGRTHVGTRVVALPMDHRHIAQTEAANGFAQSLR
jgi:lipoprotein-anchoring transpeptidase ErfK/SrfK